MDNPIFKGMKPSISSIVIGYVEKYTKDNNTAEVIILPQMWRFSNVRQATAFAGGNLSIVSDMKAGDVVLVALVNDSIDEPIIIGRVWHSKMTVPSKANGDSLITHSSGTTIRIGDAGDVTITAASGKKVYVNNSEVVLDGNSTAGHTHGPGTFVAGTDLVTGTSGSATDQIIANQT